MQNKRAPIIASYECSECFKEFNVTIQPFITGHYSGPPEDCYPDEGGEFEPTECNRCGTKISESFIEKIFDDGKPEPPEYEPTEFDDGNYTELNKKK